MRLQDLITQKQLLKEIKRPKFLTDLNLTHSNKNLAWLLSESLLQTFLLGCKSEFITDAQAKKISNKALRIFAEIRDLLDSKDFLMLWFFVSDTYQRWVELSLQSEDYETVVNLKKIWKNLEE